MPLWTVSLLAMCRMHGRQLLCTWDRKAAQLCAKEPARSTSHLLIQCLIRSHSLFPLYAPGISCQHAVHSTPSSLQTHLLSSGMVFIPWCSAPWQHLFYSPNLHLFTIFSIKTYSLTPSSQFYCPASCLEDMWSIWLNYTSDFCMTVHQRQNDNMLNIFSQSNFWYMAERQCTNEWMN